MVDDFDFFRERISEAEAWRRRSKSRRSDSFSFRREEREEDNDVA